MQEKYCTQACQRERWPTHKLVCRPPLRPVTPVRPWPAEPSYSDEPPYMSRSRTQYGHKGQELIVTALTAFQRGGITPEGAIATARQAGFPDMCDGMGVTLLHLACFRSESVHLVKQLLDLGAAVDPHSNFVPTPLHVAALRGNTDVIKLLIERGADVNAACCLKENAYLSTAQRMMALGVSGHMIHPFAPIQQDRPGKQPGEDVISWWYPLHWAALCLNDKGPAAIRLLLNSGALPNQKGGDEARGWTPLHMAAMNGLAANVRALMEEGSGVDIHAIDDNYGQTPLFSAVTWRWVSSAGFAHPMMEITDRLNIGIGLERWSMPSWRLPSPADLNVICCALVSAGCDPTIRKPAMTKTARSGEDRSVLDTLEGLGNRPLAEKLRGLWAAVKARGAPAAQ